MEAAIVYHGGGGGGILFEGIKFHLLRRLPTRNTWKDMVQQNGGELVALEKQADIVIADHARKDAPPGSISWTYIEKSVKNGRLEDIEDHRAGPAERVVREVGSAQPGRSGRTPFTDEDDRILMEWCARAERKGASLKGNELYRQLEEKNPRHTMQSWRDRWIKHISHRLRPFIPDNEDEEKDVEGKISRPHVPSTRATQVRQAAPRRQLPPARTTVRPSAPRAVVEKQSSDREATPQQTFIAKSTGGTNFTDEEIQLLLETYDDILNIDEDQIIDAWIAWAHAHPKHTAQEWRNCFNKEIKAKKKAQVKSQLKAQPKTQSKVTPKTQLTTQPTATRSSPKHNKVVLPTISKPPVVSKAKSKLGRSVQRSEPPRAQEIKDSQGSSDQSLQSPNVTKATDPTVTNETLFKADLSYLADALELEVNFNPVICGKKVPLFQLWQVVMSDEFGGFDHVTGSKKWAQVARRFNFNDYRHLNAAHDLQACYSEILADFENAREEYREVNPEMTLTESQEEAMIEDQLHQEAARVSQLPEGIKGASEDGEEYDDDLDYPQSSPAVKAPSSSSKRSFEVDRANTSGSFSKRQRIDKGKGREVEIPSTPEDKIKNTQPRLKIKPSPLKQASLEPEDDSESDELFVRPNKPSRSKPMPKPQNLEPETQDFHFPPEPEDQGFVEMESSPIRSQLPVRDQSSISNTNATRGSGPSQNDSTQSQTESQQAHDLQEYIDRQGALGYPQDIIIEALEATTMVVNNQTSFVMEALLNGRGIPEDEPGVWTTWDDEALDSGEQGAETDEYRRVVLKHGKDRIKVRRSYLRDVKEVREENP